MDISGYNQQPKQNVGWAHAIFFIIFVCISAHFMIKAFIAVFVEQVIPALLCSLPPIYAP